jgi:hypothetical protein
MRLLLVLLLSSAACVRAPVVPRVPAEQAAWFKFPRHFPEQDAQSISGPMAAAITLALQDFLPSDRESPDTSDRMAACLAQRAAYDVIAFPGPEEQVFVSISLSPGACQEEGPVLEVGATYAVDVRQGLILAVQP